MTLLAVGPQYGVKYTLTGPDGTICTFNDSSDPNNVGTLTEITGFDSPEVRESADDLVQQDGGLHGDFFFGRRPITITGLVHGHSSAAERNLRLTRLMQATNAMRADAVLTWLPDGGTTVNFVTLRRQQPLRISGGWNKEFQISMVAADPRIYSNTLHTQTVNATDTGGAAGFSFPMVFPLDFGPASVSGQMFVENQGNAVSYPELTVTGPGTNPSIYNATTDETIALIYTLAAGETFVLDTLNRTVLLNGTESRYSAVDFLATDWWGLAPGTNDIRLQYFAPQSGASLQVAWRDAWL